MGGARPSAGQFAVRVALLAVALTVISLGLERNAVGTIDETTPYWVLKWVLDVGILSYVAVRSRWRGTKLVGSLVFVYAGLQSLAVLEAGLYGLLDWSIVERATARSVVMGVLVAIAVAAGFGRIRGDEHPPTDDRLRLPLREWAWKLPVLVAAFLVLFVLAGLVLFLGVAQVIDPAALADYDILEPPSWVFVFQAGRGLAYALLVLPVIYQLEAGLRETRLVVGLVLGLLVSSGILIPNASIPGRLWVAHFLELFVSAFVYGFLVTALTFDHHAPLAAVRQRIGKN